MGSWGSCASMGSWGSTPRSHSHVHHRCHASHVIALTCHDCEQMPRFVCYLRGLCLSWLLLGFCFLGFSGFLGFFFGDFLLNFFGDLVAVAVCFSRPPRRRGFGLS